MNNYIGPGKNITVTFPYQRNSGQGLLVGGLFGVAFQTTASGSTGVMVTEGQFTGLAKASGTGEAWAVGDRLFWDDSAKNLTKNSTGKFPVGVCLEAIATGVTTAGQVKIGPTVATGA